MRKKFYKFFNKILIIIQKLLRKISENKKIGFNKDNYLENSKII